MHIYSFLATEVLLASIAISCRRKCCSLKFYNEDKKYIQYR